MININWQNWHILGKKKRFAIDEFLFIHLNGRQLWVIGLMDTSKLNRGLKYHLTETLMLLKK